MSEDNYLVVDDFITDEELTIFLGFFQGNLQEETFKRAGIGAGTEFQVKQEIRGDYIRWLNRDTDQQIGSFFERVDEVIANLNRLCYLSLSGAEFHMAHYPVGTFYKRHLDQFSQSSNRLISMILYLNQDWKEGDGGELKVYLAKGEETIAPLAKRVVFMRSDQVEHEVMMTNKDRFSLTGWLLYRPPGLTYLS